MDEIMGCLNLKDTYSVHTIYTKPEEITIKSRWTGELEKSRKSVVTKMMNILLPTAIVTKLVATPEYAHANSTEDKADKIRHGFEQLLDVFTALAEPILWFYALTACILIATKNKETGITRLKHVAYAYAGIALLPTFFALLRWVADMIKGSISF